MLRLLITLGVLAAGAPAGEVFGDVRLGEQYIADAAIQLKCGDEIVKGKTDKSGSFRLAVKSGGKCVFSVTHDSQSPSIDVVVFEKPARYRIMLEKKEGTWVLRRV